MSYLRAIRCTTGKPVWLPDLLTSSTIGPASSALRRPTDRSGMPIPVSSMRKSTSPASARWTLIVTAPGEYLVALSSSAAIRQETSSAA